MSRWILASVLALVALASAFENAKQRQRKAAMRDAVDALNVPGFSQIEAKCAACEAVARSMEDKMKTGKHLGGAHDRLSVLYDVCDNIEENLPMTMKPIEEGGPEALHFWKAPKQQLDELKGGQIKDIGLGEFCTAVVGEYEEELSGVMESAKPLHSGFGKKLGGVEVKRDRAPEFILALLRALPYPHLRHPHLLHPYLLLSTHPRVRVRRSRLTLLQMPMYELKVAVCVDATATCTNDGLNRITSHRMAQYSKDMDTDKLKDLLGELNVGEPQALKPGADVQDVIKKGKEKAAKGDAKGKKVPLYKVCECCAKRKRSLCFIRGASCSMPSDRLTVIAASHLARAHSPNRIRRPKRARRWLRSKRRRRRRSFPRVRDCLRR